MDIDGDRVIIGNAGDSNELEDQEVPIYQRATRDHLESRRDSIVPPQGMLWVRGEVALRGDDAIVDAVASAPTSTGYPTLTRRSAGSRPPDAYLQFADLALSRCEDRKERRFRVRARAQLRPRGARSSMCSARMPPRPEPTITSRCWRRRGGGPLIRVVRCQRQRRDRERRRNGVHLRTARVVHEPPRARTTSKRETPRTGRTIAGSQFSVVANGANRIYRQSSTAGEARAAARQYELDQPGHRSGSHADGIRRQRPVGRSGDAIPGRAELLLRHAAQLGQRATEAHARRRVQHHRFHAHSRDVNRRYRLRLESIGSVHRVYVDGALLLDADDAGAPH